MDLDMKTFNYYMDPGHGWIAVEQNDLVALGIAEKITAYSYRKGVIAYLEEDCDAAIFVRAFEDRYGRKPAIIPIQENRTSKIRNYRSYWC